jgi:hypothetical protein
MKLFGQLESACLEQLSSDPGTSVQGRFWENTTEARIKHDNGVTKRALFRNDDKIIVGNDGTPANNVRIHRGGVGLIQDVFGDDVTSEGSSATLFAERSFRLENKLNSGLPAAGNVGRNIFVTDQYVVAVDDGTNWRKVIPEFSNNDATTGTTVQLAAITASVVRLTGTFATLSMIPAGFASQRVTLINRTGADVSVSHDSGATPANRVLTGTGANLVFKNNSSLPLYYDGTTQRWQVVGEASGAASGGGALPNSMFTLITSDYTVLVTDDVILADTTLGPINATLPNPVGNFGKVLEFEKTGRQNNPLVLVGTVSGMVNEEIWALNAPLRIISDGSTWKKISAINGTLLFETPDPSLFVLCAATSTANVSLETMSEASLTTIDNIRPKSGQKILLKSQTAPEENGIYVMPATNIVIAATATGNENIATLANGSVVNAHICSTGEKVSLRFQTNPAENGIYVIGATAGTTVRDTSQRDPSYTTPLSLRDAVVWSDFYNYPAASVALCATETVASHTNDLQLWRQTNQNLSTFTGQGWSGSSFSFSIKVPSGVSLVKYEVCGTGGGGAGALTTRGAGGGCGTLPIEFSLKYIGLAANIGIVLPVGSKPGTGKTGTAGAQTSIQISQDTNSYLITGGLGALATGVTTTTPAALPGGPLFTAGAIPNGSGGSTYFAAGGAAGTGGAAAGGGGGSGQGNGGNGGNGSAAANFLGGNGGTGTILKFGAGGGGGGQGPASGRPGRGGFGGPGFVRITWA